MATFFNQATLTYNGNTINSNVTTGELVNALTVTKTAVIDTYTQGSEVTYVVSIVNTGDAPIAGVTVTDDLGEYDFNGTTLVPLTYVDGSATLFINGALQADPAVAAGPTLVISGLTIPAGGIATLLYVARVNEFAPLDAGRTIVNRAVVTGSCADVEATAVITVRAEAELTITKALTPATVTCGGSLTYTFVIQNTGNAPVVATDNAVITDTFDPALRDITVTLNGVVLTEGADYTYNEAAGVFATRPSRITVPAAAFTQNADGTWTVQPGVSTLTVSGTV